MPRPAGKRDRPARVDDAAGGALSSRIPEDPGEILLLRPLRERGPRPSRFRSSRSRRFSARRRDPLFRHPRARPRRWALRVEIGDGGPKLRDARCGSATDVGIGSHASTRREETRFVLDILARFGARDRRPAALLGFAGAPWTLASYLVEGGGSKNFTVIKADDFARPAHAPGAPDEARDDGRRRTCQPRSKPGPTPCSCSTPGRGSSLPADYREFALPYARDAIARIRRAGKPVIYFVNGVSGILDLAAQTGADVLSIDWRCRLDEARRRVPGTAAAGKPRPRAASRDARERRGAASRILAETGGESHI